MLDIVCVGQASLDANRELVLVQKDFSAAFDRVNHARLLFKLQSVSVGVYILLSSVVSCWVLHRE